MTRRSRLLLGLALALVVLPSLLAPVAVADHVFSHRLIVIGRVVGSDGAPVAGAPVELEFVNATVGGLCFDSREETTGPTGDFRLCRHAHRLPESGVYVDVTVLGNTTRAVVDTVLRQASVLMQLDGPTPRAHTDVGGERAFNRSVLVTGRLFELGEAQVENVDVTGTPLPGELVFARVEDANGVLVAQANDTTDASGDYSILVEAGDLPEGARVHLETAYGARNQTLDPTFRRANIDVVHEPFMFAPDVERPGTSSGRVPAPGVVVVLAVLALAAAVVPAASGRAALAWRGLGGRRGR